MTGASQTHLTVTWNLIVPLHSEDRGRKKEGDALTARLITQSERTRKFPMELQAEVTEFQLFEENLIALTENIADDKER